MDIIPETNFMESILGNVRNFKAANLLKQHILKNQSLLITGTGGFET